MLAVCVNRDFTQQVTPKDHDWFSAARLLVWVALTVVLLRKLAFEEQVLAERFPEYRPYQHRTWRLLPPLY